MFAFHRNSCSPSVGICKRADLVIFTTDTEGIIRKAVEFVMSGDLTDTRPIDELFRLVMVDGKVVFSR